MENPQSKWGFRWGNHLSMGRFGRVWLLEGMLVKWQVFPPRISTISHALSFLWATRVSQLGKKPLLAMKFDAVSLYLNAWVTVLFCFLIFTSWMSLEDERFSKRSKHILSVDVHTSWQVIYNPYVARDLKMLKISKQDAITMFYTYMSYLDKYIYLFLFRLFTNIYIYIYICI